MTLTRMMITGAVIALGIYDLIAVMWGGIGDSISYQMQLAGNTSPVVVFVLGYIAGHIFGFFPPRCPSCGEVYGRK